MTIKTLHNLFLECNKVSTDTRKVKKHNMFLALKGDNFDGNKFAEQALKKGAKYVVIDDKEYYTSKQMIVVDNVLESLQQLATFHRDYLDIPIVALTGSNGKTTTKELINATLSQKYNTTATIGNLNNHIGVPLTLLSMTKDTEIGIVEMGANHLKEIEFLCTIAKPNFGYITNFGKAHLEGFGSLEGVIKGKSELYNYLKTNNAYIFLNADDAKQKEILNPYIKKFGFSQTNTEYFKIDLIEAKPFVRLKTENITITSNLIGEYNFTNICASVIIAKYFNVELEAIKKGIEAYVPSNNRSQILEKESNKIILDAYNANPSSMKVALENFSQLEDKNKIAILGDMFELGTEAELEHQNIANLASNLKIDTVFLVGENFFTIEKTSEKIMQFSSFNDLKEHFPTIKNTTLLIKGSRGMALERVVDLF